MSQQKSNSRFLSIYKNLRLLYFFLLKHYSVSCGVGPFFSMQKANSQVKFVKNGQPIHANIFQIFITFSDFSKYFRLWNKLIIKIVLIGNL